MPTDPWRSLELIMNDFSTNMGKHLADINEHFASIDECLNGIDERLNGIDERLGQVESGFKKVRSWQKEFKIIFKGFKEEVNSQFDEVNKRLDNAEEMNFDLLRKYRRLESRREEGYLPAYPGEKEVAPQGAQGTGEIQPPNYANVRRSEWRREYPYRR